MRAYWMPLFAVKVREPPSGSQEQTERDRQFEPPQRPESTLSRHTDGAHSHQREKGVDVQGVEEGTCDLPEKSFHVPR